MINGIQNALIATGGDTSEVTKDESRLLAMQLMKLTQPQDRKALESKIERNVRNRFILLDMDLSTNDQGLGVSANGTKWYAADKNFLYGSDSNAKDYRRAQGDQIADAFYSSKVSGGKARLIYGFKHPHKHQQVAILRRIITSKASLARGVKLVQQAIGKLAASWFATAKTINQDSSAPAYVSRHITRGTQSTKSITDLSGLHQPANPSVTFGSKARGAASKKAHNLIEFALHVREQKLAARLKLILSGYSKDVTQGIKVQRRAKKVKGSP